MPVFITSRSHVDFDHLVWIVHLHCQARTVHYIIMMKMRIQPQVPPLGRRPNAVHYTGKRAGSPDLGHIWKSRRHLIQDTTTDTQGQVPAILSSSSLRDFQLEISRICDAPVLTFWLARRSSQTSPLWHSSSELKQICRPCWKTRLKSRAGGASLFWNTGTGEAFCLHFLTLHTVFTLHRTRQLMRTRG